MVRTKADRVPLKAVGAKAPNKSVKSATPKKVTLGGKGKSYSGGNPYHPRETPEWQKPITCFLNQNSEKDIAGSSGTQKISKESADEDIENESE
ncbi:PCNA-associated factor-like [Colletes gigas]|uniref:PCNA-associated factor-like n=1 Tax=Colletes gigas TaxID=935657 RepID=UPI001C9A7969|nr:PCNA-associated factor-like [Colletes gigas]